MSDPLEDSAPKPVTPELTPYAAGAGPDEPLDAVVLPLDAVPALAPVAAKPRIWTALVVAIVAIATAVVVSGIVLLVCLAGEYGAAALRGSPVERQQMIEEYVASRAGLIVVIVPGQLVFLVTASVAAAASPQPWRERLRLTVGTWPMWSWPVLALATPMIGYVSSAVISQFTDFQSENLQLLETLFRQQEGPFVAALYFLVGFLPGLGEELLFRGYVQSRLTQVLAPWAAIGLTSAMFAIAHMDPIQVLGVFPLGVWLGVVAWRTGSLWPAIFGHVTNNCLAIMMTRWGEVSPTDDVGLAQRMVVVACSGFALLVSLVLLAAMRPQPEESAHV